MIRNAILVFVICCLFLAVACNHQVTKQQKATLTVSEDEGSFELMMGKNKRKGKVFIPSTYSSDRTYSLVIGLHGYGGSGEFNQLGGLKTIGEQMDFIIVYPDGLENTWQLRSNKRGLNNDIIFFEELIDQLCRNYSIDEQRIYAAGYSMGGYMAYRLAYTLSDRVTAVASVAGLVYGGYLNKRKSPQPVSLLHLHAIDDPAVPYDGNKLWNILSAAESVDMWRTINGQGSGLVEEKLKNGAVRRSWAGEENGIDIDFITYSQGGHRWFKNADELVSAFFYNHPSRGNKVSFSGPDIRPIFTANGPLTLETAIEKPEEVKKVTLYSGNDVIEEKTSPPFDFIFNPEINRKYYLHLKAQTSTGEQLASLNSLRFWSTLPSLALNADVIASGSEDQAKMGPQNVIDEDVTTRWASLEVDNAVLQLDFKKETSLKGVTIIWETAYAAAYTIEVSDDAEKWVPVFDQENGRGGTEFITFPPVTARYLRFKGKKRATSWGYSIWEFMVH